MITETPCFVGRPAVATKCIEKFALEYCKKYKKIPSKEELRKHIPAFNTYTSSHKESLYRRAFEMCFDYMEELSYIDDLFDKWHTFLSNHQNNSTLLYKPRYLTGLFSFGIEWKDSQGIIHSAETEWHSDFSRKNCERIILDLINDYVSKYVENTKAA